MSEKLQLVTEESFQDPANSQFKQLEHHQAFEVEIATNADRIQVNPFYSDSVRNHLKRFLL